MLPRDLQEACACLDPCFNLIDKIRDAMFVNGESDFENVVTVVHDFWVKFTWKSIVYDQSESAIQVNYS